MVHSAIQLWWTGKNPGRGFGSVLLATILYSSGLSAYLFLLNIFLANHRFTERTIGILASATVLGTMAGTLPAGILAGRFGPRNVVVGSLLLIGPVFAVRACILGFYPQLVLSVVCGIALCGWVVCIVPLAAGVVTQSRRPFALSILFATSIVSCGAGGFLGGHLPGRLLNMARALGWGWRSLTEQRATLIAVCLLVYLAIWPLSRLDRGVRAAPMAASSRLRPALLRLYAASACWAASIGCFTPFVGLYFAHHLGVGLDRLGTLFSLLQLIEAVMVLSVPVVLRRLSLLSAIMATQLASAGALLLLAAGRGWGQAAIGLCGYLAAMHMSEPTMQSLLMDRVAPEQRTSASGIYFLVTSLAQAGAAIVGGATITRSGYRTLLACAVIAMGVSAVLFRVLCSPSSETPAWTATPIDVDDAAALTFPK